MWVKFLKIHLKRKKTLIMTSNLEAKKGHNWFFISGKKKHPKPNINKQ